jgi:hypothetical protein
MPVDAATAASRYAASAGTASQRYTEGVQATNKDVGALAAAQAPKMLANVTAAVTSGYWAQRTIEGGAKWKSNTIAKASNYSTGIQQGQQAYQQGYGQFWNYMGPYWQQIQSMPKTTLGDSIARASAWITAASNYRKS